MAIGNSAGLSASGLNNSLGSASVYMRNACQQVLEFVAIVNELGTAGLEAAPVSMDSADAAAFVAAADYLQTVAQVYYGTAAQASEFNFDNALAAARGGQ